MRLWERGLCSASAWAGEGILSFVDPSGCNGFYPSPNYLSTVRTEWVQNPPVAMIDRLVKGLKDEVCHHRCRAVQGNWKWLALMP